MSETETQNKYTEEGKHQLTKFFGFDAGRFNTNQPNTGFEKEFYSFFFSLKAQGWQMETHISTSI